MMDKGEYFPPEPYQNLENAIRKVQQAYLMYRNQGADEDRLELLRQYMEDCQNLLIKAQEPSIPPDELAQQLAEAGGGAAAAEVMEQAPKMPVGEESLIAEGDIPLGDEAAMAEEAPMPEEEVTEEIEIDEDIEL
jgi:hypothetical protein